VINSALARTFFSRLLHISWVFQKDRVFAGKDDFTPFQYDCKLRLRRAVDLTSNRTGFSVKSCSNDQTLPGTFPKNGRSRQEKCAAQCAVKQTQAEAAACYVPGIEDFSSHLNVIGPQVRKIRTNKGWTQNQLALKLQLFGWDTSRESVTRLENQSRRVPDLELFVVAKILGVKADDLFPRNLRGKIKELAPHYRVKLSRGQVPPTV
jgi:DNA-binding XRE family transcriptional regulator